MIKKILFSTAIVLIAMGVLLPGGIWAQGTPPNIKVGLALTDSLPSYPAGRLVYHLGNDPIRMVISLENKEQLEHITTKGFPQRPFHLLLIFTDPDGRTILTNDPEELSGGDAPPPRVFPVQVQPEKIELKQVEPVESLGGGWVVSVEIPNAHAYYTLTKAGNYSVKAVIPMRTYKTINYSGSPDNYSEIDDFKWSGALSSNTEKFTLLTDADEDGYYYPEGYPSGALADCNDNDPKEKPGQTWYKDADDDGYSDGTTDTTSCKRPQGYKVASELTATSGDCDDNNLAVNPGMTEVVCNEIDDDCSSATLDFPAPALASPANGATGVSTTPTLSWGTSCTGSSYTLQVSTTDTFSTTVFDQSGITGTSQTVSGLANNTLYYWRVNAANAGGTSEWSPAWSFTTTAGEIYVLTVKKAGTGSGTVTAMPGELTWDGNVGTASYPKGTKVTLTAIANTGSTFTGWSAYCSGSGNCSVVISGSTCTVNMCGPCNATATFKLNTTTKKYTIKATAGTGGKISPSGYVKVNEGANRTFTITPNSRYKIKDVKVDNISQGPISTYTFYNVTANHTISATFTKK